MYTANLGNLLDLFETDLPTWKTTTTLNSEYASGYIKQHDNLYELAFDVVGHSKDSISIDVEGNLLKIKAESKIEKDSVLKNLVSDINHSVRIPATFDLSQTTAEVENGILLITIPKKEEAKQKKISVKVK